MATGNHVNPFTTQPVTQRALSLFPSTSRYSTHIQFREEPKSGHILWSSQHRFQRLFYTSPVPITWLELRSLRPFSGATDKDSIWRVSVLRP